MRDSLGAARTLDKARIACDCVGGQTTPMACELTDPASVRGCAAALRTGAALNGTYLADCQVARPRADAQDPALARRLWEVSESIVAALP